MSHVADIAAVAASVDADADFSFKMDLEGDEGPGLGGGGGGETLGNRLANTLEASDEVMLSVASSDEMDDEDDDGAHLFKPTNDDGLIRGSQPGGIRLSVDAPAHSSEEYEPDFEAESPRGNQYRGSGGGVAGMDGQSISPRGGGKKPIAGNWTRQPPSSRLTDMYPLF